MNKPLTPQQELDQVLQAEVLLQQDGSGPDFQLLLRRANWLEELNRYEEALLACDKAERLLLEQDIVDQGEIAGRRTKIYMRLGRFNETLASAQQAEQLRSACNLPPDWQIKHWRSVVLMDQGKIDQSLQASREAEAIIAEQGLVPYAGISNLQGALHCMVGNYEESQLAYEKSLQIHDDQKAPPHPGLLSNIGMTYLQSGRPAEAIEYFEEARRQFSEQGIPPMTEYLSARGMALAELGRFDEALASSRESDRLRREQGREEDWNWHASAGMIYYMAGRKAEAIAEITKALLICGRRGINPQRFVMETLEDWMAPRPEALVEEQLASQPTAVQPIPDNEKKHDVFICYRRDPGHTHSMLLQAHMDIKQKSVFRDQDGLSSGRFEDGLKEAIRYSRHMVILLTPEFLNRCCSDEKDVVRNEIATALHHGTHIIPVMMEGFQWPAEEELPEDIRAITGINAMSWSTEFFTAFIDKLLLWMGE